MKILLESIAAIFLVVGGMGIMGIKLVSVTEKTRELGLRLAKLQGIFFVNLSLK